MYEMKPEYYIGIDMIDEEHKQLFKYCLLYTSMWFQMIQYRKNTTSITTSGKWKKVELRPDTSGILMQSAL